MNAAHPLLITQGDPAGIGPEVILKAHAAVGAQVPLLAVGCLALMQQTAALLNLPAPVPHTQPQRGALAVIDIPLTQPVTPGQPDPCAGVQVMACLDHATDLCRTGQAAALITAPVAKSVLYAAGFDKPGQTEYVARRSGATSAPVMMLCAGDVRVSLVTIHLPLRAVADAITPTAVDHALAVTHTALRRDFGIAHPRIAICGLNPHAGEDGALGHEDAEIIAPVCAQARAMGWAVDGPLPADTLFHASARTRYDAYLAMYHDQGLIPLKTIDFWGGVNVSLGLPIIRTSPDHGTAFDIAGRGIARPDSMVAAIQLAAAMATARGGA